MMMVIVQKFGLYLCNKNVEGYDFVVFIVIVLGLVKYVCDIQVGMFGIDFVNFVVVWVLNWVLLVLYYGVCGWELLVGYFCLLIFGWVDYIYYVVDLLVICNKKVILIGCNVCVLDIGVGVNCVYLLIGYVEYGWCFFGIDIDLIVFNNV